MSRCPDIDEQMSQKSDEQMSDEQVLHNLQVVDFSLASTFHKQAGLQVIALNTNFGEASAGQLSTLLLKKRTPSRSSEK